MKTIFFVIAALAATVLFSSCNKDKATSDEGGEATTMEISIKFPGVPQTRATFDPNALDSEAELKKVDIFIYYPSGTLQRHQSLTASAFSANPSNGTDADVYTSTTKIQTTTGSKKVVAGINLPQSVVDDLNKKPMIGTLTTVAQTMSRAQMTGANGFVMFSTEPVSGTFVVETESNAATANRVVLRCERLVAKVTVETDVDLVITGVPGTLSNLQFAVNNFNNKLFMLQGIAPERRDPNWVRDPNNLYYAGDFEDTPATDYVDVLNRRTIANPTKNDYRPRYASENTTESKIKGEATRATVRGEFIPANLWTYTGGVLTQTTNIAVTPVTFYHVRIDMEGDYYFGIQSQAADFAVSKGKTAADVNTYTGGRCYWDIYLNKNPRDIINQWDVLRNDFYQCNIKRIVAPGRNVPEVLDPWNPIEVETNITAEINVVNWHTPVLSDYDLE